jgi:hypothetical protein
LTYHNGVVVNIPSNTSTLSYYAGPTLATSGLALQVPVAVVSDAILKHPAWMDSTLTTIVTLLGGCVILAAFFGLNARGEKEENDLDEQSSASDQHFGSSNIPLTHQEQ